MSKKIKIAIAGGSCTGKSTVAAKLFVQLKMAGYDFDLITEESRKIKKEFGSCKSPAERFFLWDIQEEAENNSTAKNGFVTDVPLFHMFAHAIQWATKPRDLIATARLFGKCMEIKNRYDLIAIEKDPKQIGYKKDGSREGTRSHAMQRDAIIRGFIAMLVVSDRVIYVAGPPEKRAKQILKKIRDMKLLHKTAVA